MKGKIQGQIARAYIKTKVGVDYLIFIYVFVSNIVQPLWRGHLFDTSLMITLPILIHVYVDNTLYNDGISNYETKSNNGLK